MLTARERRNFVHIEVFERTHGEDVVLLFGEVFDECLINDLATQFGEEN
jgi:hypothetical protein